MSKSIVIVGGGAAGWLTALMAKKSYPDSDITLVESKEIGILGAGEGTTPLLPDFLNYLDVSISDLVKHCDATIKNAIKFTNWKNDNTFYYHAFGLKDQGLIGPQTIPYRYLSNNPLHVASLSINNSLTEIDAVEKVSEKNKVPFIFKAKQDKDPILDYHDIASVAVHFNAIKLANRLKEIALSRGVNLVEGTIKDVVLNENNNVKALNLENEKEVLCDFVFDCSGFSRLIIGKVFQSKWKSYKSFLPSDSAIPFFIDMTDKIPAYTEAIAMKYGWVWKIPLQNRFGCGYVYDSSLISEEDAIKEIEEFLGYTPEYPRKGKGGFKFDAGAYEEPWINNCVAVGLAANFIEPLEATSLWVSVLAIKRIFENPSNIFINSELLRKEFNKYILSINDEISSFVYFHYMSPRQDTDFWKKFSYENAPENLKERLDVWKYRLPASYDSNVFGTTSWLAVGSAQELINKSVAKEYITNSKEYKKGSGHYDFLINYQKYRALECVDHREFLNRLNEI
jgi:tryptophan 7-halogenase